MFGIGFAPRTCKALLTYLRGKGFSDAELVTAGLVARNDRGPYDRFRGRLLWPIRQLSGDVVGFGARHHFDDDRVEAKSYNTPRDADPTRRASCCTASTSRAARSPASRRRSWSRATPT